MIRTVIAAVFALVLVGCSSAPAAAPSPSAPVAISDAQYLSLVRDQGWAKPPTSDADLLRIGQVTCEAITSKPADGTLSQWKKAVSTAVGSGLMTAEQAGGFLVYASARFCPDARDAYFPKS